MSSLQLGTSVAASMSIDPRICRPMQLFVSVDCNGVWNSVFLPLLTIRRGSKSPDFQGDLLILGNVSHHILASYASRKSPEFAYPVQEIS